MVEVGEFNLLCESQVSEFLGSLAEMLGEWEMCVREVHLRKGQWRCITSSDAVTKTDDDMNDNESILNRRRQRRRDFVHRIQTPLRHLVHKAEIFVGTVGSMAGDVHDMNDFRSAAADLWKECVEHAHSYEYDVDLSQWAFDVVTDNVELTVVETIFCDQPDGASQRGWTTLRDPVNEITPQVIIDIKCAFVKMTELVKIEAELLAEEQLAVDMLWLRSASVDVSQSSQNMPQTAPAPPTPSQTTPAPPTPSQTTPEPPTPSQTTPAPPTPSQITPQTEPVSPTPSQTTPVSPTPSLTTPAPPTPSQTTPVPPTPHLADISDTRM